MEYEKFSICLYSGHLSIIQGLNQLYTGNISSLDEPGIGSKLLLAKVAARFSLKICVYCEFGLINKNLFET